MIDKNVLKRIYILEQEYPVDDFNIEEYTKEYISMLENALGHSLVINLPNKKYHDKDTLERDILRQIPIEDLKLLADTIIEEKRQE